MRVLVCGGRDFRDEDFVFRKLSQFHRTLGPFTLIIHGSANGADKCAKRWAQANSIKHWPFKPDWHDLSHPNANIRVNRLGQRYDAMAGIRRNKQMLVEGKPKLVIAFPGGTGTKNMTTQAEKAGVEVIYVKDAL